MTSGLGGLVGWFPGLGGRWKSKIERLLLVESRLGQKGADLLVCAVLDFGSEGFRARVFWLGRLGR